MQRGALKVDKGINVRKFSLALLAAVIVFGILIAGFLVYTARTGHPNVHPLGKAGDGNTALQKK